MKSALRLVLLLAALSLFAACSGGGGGGGGGVLPGGDITLPGGDIGLPGDVTLPGGDSALPGADDPTPGDDGPTPITGFANIVAYYAADGSGSINFRNSFNLEKTSESFLVYSSIGDPVMFLTGDGEGTTSKFYADGAFIKAEKDETFNAKSPDGSYEVIDGSYSIYLGGKNLGLEFADFGIWLETVHVQAYDAEHNQLDGSASWLCGEGFWIDTKAHEQTPNAGTFEGTTVAWAYNSFAEGNPHALLRGTATLDVTGQGAGLQGNLSLEFANYYSFSFGSVPISDSGSMQDMMYSLSVQVAGDNNLGVSEGLTFDLAESYLGNLDSQFYGREGASEAVGNFYIFSNSSPQWVKGAFGVKEVVKP